MRWRPAPNKLRAGGCAESCQRDPSLLCAGISMASLTLCAACPMHAGLRPMLSSTPATLQTWRRRGWTGTAGGGQRCRTLAGCGPPPRPTGPCCLRRSAWCRLPRLLGATTWSMCRGTPSPPDSPSPELLTLDPRPPVLQPDNSSRDLRPASWETSLACTAEHRAE